MRLRAGPPRCVSPSSLSTPRARPAGASSRCSAEFETNLRKERQLEGIAKAKAAGKYRGRPRGIDAAKIGELRQKGLGATEITRRLGIARVGLSARRERAA
jgi:hypothetical protein